MADAPVFRRNTQVSLLFHTAGAPVAKSDMFFVTYLGV